MQDVTEEELRTACEKQQAQILQYVFGSMLFFISFIVSSSFFWYLTCHA